MLLNGAWLARELGCRKSDKLEITDDDAELKLPCNQGVLWTD